MNENNELQLHLQMYPPQLPHSTLAIVGMFQPWGAVMPIAEMQARFHCEMLLKRIKLPSKERMLKAIVAYRKRMVQRYGDSRRHTVQVSKLTIFSKFLSKSCRYVITWAYIITCVYFLNRFYRLNLEF